jgi:hypothetical protein
MAKKNSTATKILVQPYRSFNKHDCSLDSGDRIGVMVDMTRRMGLVVNILKHRAAPNYQSLANLFNARFKTTTYTSNDFRTALLKLEKAGIVGYSGAAGGWHLTQTGLKIWERAKIVKLN